MRRILIIFLLAVASLSWMPAFAEAAVAVPSGNRNAEQPPVPGASVRRTRGTNSTFDRKYQKVREDRKSVV